MSGPAGSKTFGALDGLRATFLFWVMFVHTPPESLSPWLAHAQERISFGVDGFLAISGFLVLRSLMISHQSQKGALGRTLWEYFARRTGRIWPAYYGVLAVLLGAAHLTHGGFHEHLEKVPGVERSLWLLYANYLLPLYGQLTPIALQIYWSISYQEQFYFLLAALFAGCQAWSHHVKTTPKRALTAALLGMAAFSIVARLVGVLWLWRGEERAFHLETWLHLNFDGVAWGCLAWLHFDRLKRAPNALLTAGALATAILAVASRWFWFTDVSEALLSTFKAPALALLVRAACDWQAPWLRSRALGAIGRASFEVYLIHVILYGFLQSQGLARPFVFQLVAYPLALAAGLALHHGFGKPAQRAVQRLFAAMSRRFYAASARRPIGAARTAPARR